MSDSDLLFPGIKTTPEQEAKTHEADSLQDLGLIVDWLRANAERLTAFMESGVEGDDGYKGMIAALFGAEIIMLNMVADAIESDKQHPRPGLKFLDLLSLMVGSSGLGESVLSDNVLQEADKARKRAVEIFEVANSAS